MVNQKKLNIFAMVILVLAVALPYLGMIFPIDIPLLNNISFGMIILALILIGKKLWRWYDKEDRRSLNK